MALEEKKFRHVLESEIVPSFIDDIKKSLDVDITIDINWDSFDTLAALKEIQYQILGRIIEAINDLCRDDFAKSEVKKHFNKITVSNIANSADKKVAFSDGVLSIQANWLDFGNIFTSFDIKEAFEAGL